MNKESRISNSTVTYLSMRMNLQNCLALTDKERRALQYCLLRFTAHKLSTHIRLPRKVSFYCEISIPPSSQEPIQEISKFSPRRLLQDLSDVLFLSQPRRKGNRSRGLRRVKKTTNSTSS